ncbi:MAG: DUF952 domain-containing protein [Sphingobium sp.]
MTELFAYKILTRDQWEAWRAEGVFNGAPVDLADGYIHLSARDQVVETVKKHFAGQDDLILAMIDLAALGDAVKWEPSRGGALFPHVYGQIPMSAVTTKAVLRLDATGQHVFPAGFSD